MEGRGVNCLEGLIDFFFFKLIFFRVITVSSNKVNSDITARVSSREFSVNKYYFSYCFRKHPSVYKSCLGCLSDLDSRTVYSLLTWSSPTQVERQSIGELVLNLHQTICQLMVSGFPAKFGKSTVPHFRLQRFIRFGLIEETDRA